MKSQNGYSANNRKLIASYKVPGGKLAIRRGDVATVLVYVAERFHNEVEKLKWPGNWGYAERKIRGGRSLSNHASGTAIDLNAPRHYLGAKNTFTKKQVAAIRRILKDCGGVVRWGGDYRGRKDEMHFEINASPAKVKKAAEAIRKKGKVTAPAPNTKRPSPAPKNTPKFPWPNDHWASQPMRTKKAHSGFYKADRPGIKLIQARLKARGWKITVDSRFGPNTERIVRKFQAEKGLKVDGCVGIRTFKALWEAKIT